MSQHREPTALAAARFRAVVDAVSASPDRLGLPTPCEHYDVRDLLNHLLYWAPRLLAAARKEPPPAADGGEEAVDLVTGDWAAVLSRQVDDLAAALREPGAADGVTTMGGGELPASMIGGMVLCEWAIHGWDLAVATGVPFTCDPEIAAAVEQVMRGMAEQGRQMKVFGPEVPLDGETSPLRRALALSGRDPAWAPPSR